MKHTNKRRWECGSRACSAYTATEGHTVYTVFLLIDECAFIQSRFSNTIVQSKSVHYSNFVRCFVRKFRRLQVQYRPSVLTYKSNCKHHTIRNKQTAPCTHLIYCLLRKCHVICFFSIENHIIIERKIHAVLRTTQSIINEMSFILKLTQRSFHVRMNYAFLTVVCIEMC